MEVRVEQGSLTETETPLLVVNLFQDADGLSGATGAVDQAMGGLLSRLREDGELRGKAGEAIVVHNPGRRPSARDACWWSVWATARGSAPRARGARPRPPPARRRSCGCRTTRPCSTGGRRWARARRGGRGAGRGKRAGAVSLRSLQGRRRREPRGGRAGNRGRARPRAYRAHPRRPQAGAAMAAATATARDLAQGPANLVSPAVPGRAGAPSGRRARHRVPGLRPRRDP